MEWLLFFLAYFIVGVAIGRTLFVKRLGSSSRWELGTKRDYDGYVMPKEVAALIPTFDMASASTYGLWSIFAWPLTLAFFTVQAPTKAEKKAKREAAYSELVKELQLPH